MTLINVKPDRQWVVAEVQLRLTVDAAISDERLAEDEDFQKQILWNIERIESRRGWKFVEYVPRRGPGFQPCCRAMAKPIGSPIPVVVKESPLQADADDAHNGKTVHEAGHRMFVQGKRDLVAVVHFLQPAAILNLDAIKDGMPTEGFLPPEELPGVYRGAPAEEEVA